MIYSRGFALLEVLIALFIISFGLLSILGMQLFALQNVKDAYLMSIATVQLNSMLERLQASQTSTGSSNELARWNESNARVLPQGEGNCQCGGMYCVVTVSWQNKQKHTLSLSAITDR